ncbi:hypothetical protein PR202_gb10092 [Eleusine coracana subsp. coracana]|uniref:Alpha/beta hydrolase fold-3 domain-containing protein n=1 Tax=Eleusine coracana subsp. coracana TaxID=191504 RepID=A0AAV5EJJ7_ELECO|nr:hypothetical protein PR202_gb10092 [Eleusine coracana subsp. coracana]
MKAAVDLPTAKAMELWRGGPSAWLILDAIHRCRPVERKRGASGAARRRRRHVANELVWRRGSVASPMVAAGGGRASVATSPESARTLGRRGGGWADRGFRPTWSVATGLDGLILQGEGWIRRDRSKGSCTGAAEGSKEGGNGVAGSTPPRRHREPPPPLPLRPRRPPSTASPPPTTSASASSLPRTAKKRWRSCPWWSTSTAAASRSTRRRRRGSTRCAAASRPPSPQPSPPSTTASRRSTGSPPRTTTARRCSGGSSPAAFSHVLQRPSSSRVTALAVARVPSARDHDAANVPAAIARSGGASASWPPTMVCVGGWDPHQDRQQAYADASGRGWMSGREYPDAVHAFYLFEELEDSKRLLVDVAEFMKRRTEELKKERAEHGAALLLPPQCQFDYLYAQKNEYSKECD